MADPSIPSGVHPSDIVNGRDHGPLVTVAAGLFITCSLLFYGVRLLIRWPWTALFSRDDLAVTIATLLSIVQVAVICSAVPKGMGRVQQELTPAAISTIEKMIYASDLLWLLAIYASRLSVALLFFRLTSQQKHMKWCRMLTVACGVVWLIAFLLVGAQPKLGSLEPAIADGIVARWVVAELLGNLLELGLIAFPVYLVKGLQMSMATKFTILSGFALRLPLIALSIVRLVYLSNALHSVNFSFEFATAEIFSQAEMCYALISATLPCLRIFLRATYTGRLGGSVIDTPGESQMATAGSARNDTIGSAEKSQTRRMTELQVFDELSTGETQSSAVVVGNAGRDSRKASVSTKTSEQTADASDTAIMVRQTVDVRYE
ncbi:hypothetical protein K431DRAFT_307744 [Polychaeton citri CBS 116435]|uniref:Rhodopsin domain-containing protein n=1 Tax=Polychaeton citri CBS 116435 TaxID=1314669 RepID=A0A9P4Q1S0_9PEZI|nr:hypothetical protein K431DRAFT_307744 [Polychaeton citri CBS 116435]